MTSPAKGAGTDPARTHLLGKTRVVVDLFGPVIDIDKIDLFNGTNARFASEEAIAKHHRLPRHPDGKDWTGSLVLEIVKACLQDPKVALTLIDEDVVKDLCQAASFGSVWIVSSVPDPAIFKAAQVVVTKYVASCFGPGVIDDDHIIHCPREADGQPCGVEAFLRTHPATEFTIVVDDSPAYHLTDDDDLKCSTHYDIWLHGQMGGERLHSDLTTLIDARRRIEDARSIVDELDDEIKLADYCAIPGYLVYDEYRRKDLKTQVDSIGDLLKSEKQGPPICVLLSGPPGAGKSYFVERFAKVLNVQEDYPLASLSGVREGKFDQAVLEHIDQVFNHKDSGPAFAFLDEVDTAPGRSPVAFRLLMNAMTNNRMTELGLSMKGAKSGSTSCLVWFFAASGGRTREEIEARFAPADLKTHDFLDRIHFNLEMPGVDNVGQAIVQALGSLHRFDKLSGNPAAPIAKVSKDALFLMGATQWSSVRQIETFCRLVVGRRASPTASLSIKDFEGIGTLQAFQDIQAELESSPLFGDAPVEVEWEDDLLAPRSAI